MSGTGSGANSTADELALAWDAVFAGSTGGKGGGPGGEWISETGMLMLRRRQASQVMLLQQQATQLQQQQQQQQQLAQQQQQLDLQQQQLQQQAAEQQQLRRQLGEAMVLLHQNLYEQWAAGCPNLQHINPWRTATRAFIALSTGCRHLQHIALVGCGLSVSDEDALKH
jgi:hypothetical protein